MSDLLQRDARAASASIKPSAKRGRATAGLVEVRASLMLLLPVWERRNAHTAIPPDDNGKWETCGNEEEGGPTNKKIKKNATKREHNILVTLRVGGSSRRLHHHLENRQQTLAASSSKQTFSVYSVRIYARSIPVKALPFHFQKGREWIDVLLCLLLPSSGDPAGASRISCFFSHVS